MSESAAASTVCPQCDGRGWVLVADGGAGAARPCNCRRQALAPRLKQGAGIPARYRDCRLRTFETSHPDPGASRQLQAALAEARRYVDGFLRADGTGFCDSGLVFVGPAGTGKTHLAAAILNALIERYRVRGRFVEFTALIHQIQSSFDPRSPESQRSILEPVMGCDVLVLDELGSQRTSPWLRDLLYLVVNDRYTRRLPTLFTTNYRLEDPAVAPAAARGGGFSAVGELLAESSPGGEGAGERYREFGTAPRGGEASGPQLEPLSHRLSASLVSRLHEMAKPVSLEAVTDYRREVRVLKLPRSSR